MSVLAVAVALLVTAFEFQNLLAWWRGRVLDPAAEGTRDFTIVVPLFGHPRYFVARDSLRRYRSHVVVAMETTPPVMQRFADELEGDGWRVARIRATDPNPALLLREALPSVTTAHVLRLDADTLVGDDIPNAVAAFAASGADLASVKVDVVNTERVVAKLQQLEYRIAMLTRHYRPWLTSGACFIGRTTSLRAILAHHSVWTPGEDIETGRAAVALRMKIRHADITVRTEVPDTWGALVRQRRLWWAGNFRHAVVNIDRNMAHMPVMTCYWILLIWFGVLMRPWQAIELTTLPSMLPVLYLSYLVVTVIGNLKVLSLWMLVFPFYAGLQSFVMPVAGAVQYVVLARRKGRLGRYRFGWRRRRPAAAAQVQPA